MTVAKKEKYFEAVGRRKTSVARVRMVSDSGKKNIITVNDRDIESYFPTIELRNIVFSVFKDVANLDSKFKISVKVVGGGVHSQAEAVRHAIARAVTKFDSSLRKEVKSLKYLSRDPRAKERRKFGLKKARKAPQWSKR